MTIEAELFDGTVLEFPDGTDPSVIQRVVKSKTAEIRGANPGAAAPGAPAAGAATAPAPAAAPAAAPAYGPTQVAPGLSLGDVLVTPSGQHTAPNADIGTPVQTPQVDPLMDVLASVPDGLRQGVSMVAGLPVDAVNNSPQVLNLLPGEQGMGPITPNPVGGRESIDTALRFGGLVEDYEPQTRPGRIANRVSEDAGASFVPITAGGAAVRLLGEEAVRALPRFAMREPETWFPGITRNLGAPMAANPTTAATREIGAGLAAGGGAATANETFGEDNWLAELLGAVGGVGLLSAGSGIASALGSVGRAVTGDAGNASRIVREAVADTLVKNSDIAARNAAVDPTAPMNADPLVDALQMKAPVESVVPNFTATTANRSGDTGLGVLEAARQRGPNAGRYIDAAGDNATAVERTVGDLEPSQPAARFSDELRLERDRRLMDADVNVANATDAADNAARPLTFPAGARAERGGAIREGIEGARDQARANTDAAYDAYRGAAGETTGAAQDLRTAVEGARDSLTVARRGLLPNGVIDDVMRLTDGEAADINIAEVVDLQSELGRLQRAALADPKAEKGGRNAYEAIERIDAALTRYLDAYMSPEQKTLLTQAKAAKTAEADAFGRAGDPVAAAVAQREGGIPAMRDDRVASSFATYAPNIDTLFSRVDSPEVRRALREEILSRGDFTSAKSAERFMADYGEQMKRFPGLEDEVRAAATARAGAEAAQASAEQIAKDIGENGVGAVAKYLRYGDETAKRAMKQVVSDADPAAKMDELLRFVGDDPQAVEGARRAFWDVMEDAGRDANLATMGGDGTFTWAPKKWAAFLEKPEVAAVAERLYATDPEHLSRLKEIATALRQAGVGSAQRTALNPSGTELMRKASTVSLAEIQSKGYEVARGRVALPYMITYLAGRMANRVVRGQASQAYEMALDRALIDPDFAAKLLAENNPANRAALRQATKGWMGAEMSNAMVADMEQGGTGDFEWDSLLGGN